MKFDEVKVGMKLKADDGFICLNKGQIVKVDQACDELFVPCAQGHHFLDAHVDENNNLIGFEKV